MPRIKGREVGGLIQNSPAWYEWRNGDIDKNIFRIGGSEAAVIMGVNAWTNVGELYERKLGLLPDIETNEAMARGHRLEPVARVEFELETGINVRPACYLHHTHDWMAASLDGISLDGMEIVEIKCPGLKTHSEALKGNIPVYYIPQIQHQLAVTGAKKAYYFSYTDIEGVDNALITVYPDDAYIERLLEREQMFIDCLINRTPPTDDVFGVGDAIRENGDRSDPMFKKAIAKWKETFRVFDDAYTQHEASETEIIRLLQRKKQVYAIADGVRVERRFEDGKWKLLVELDDATELM